VANNHLFWQPGVIKPTLPRRSAFAFGSAATSPGVYQPDGQSLMHTLSASCQNTQLRVFQGSFHDQIGLF